MPLLTYYAYIGFRRTRMPMLTVDRMPSDWLELKQVLIEVMERVWHELPAYKTHNGRTQEAVFIRPELAPE